MSTPVSSYVSRMAVAARSASPGSARPPGQAMCPLHGSRSATARWIISSSGSLSARARSASMIAAARAPAGSVISRPGRSASARSSCLTTGCVASRPMSVVHVTAGFGPAAKPAGERAHLLVAHLVQRVRGERATVAARAIDHHLRIARNGSFDLGLQRAARDVQRTRDAPEVHLLLVAHVEEGDVAALVERARLGGAHFPDA